MSANWHKSDTAGSSSVLKIENAANWFAANRENRTRAFIPLLRERFDLTALEAIEAAKLAGITMGSDRHG